MSAGIVATGRRLRARLRRWRPWLLDGSLALLFLVIGQVEATLHAADGMLGGGQVVAHAVGVLLAVPLALRRSFPRLTMAATCGSMLVVSLLWAHPFYFWGGLLPLCFAIYPAARLVGGWFGRWSWVGAVVAVTATMVHLPSARDPFNVVMAVLTFGSCALAGRLVRRGTRTRRRLAEALARLAEEQRRAEAAAVAAERARIAGEVQDVVAHALGLMLLQVGAARLALESARRVVPPQLRAAEETGRRALEELRRSVKALDTDAPREPMPDLDDLPDLVRGFRSAGLDVRLTAEAAELPAGVQLQLYRILQEALTNALRHGGPGAVQVVLRRAEHRVSLEVRSHAARRPGRPLLPSGGHGLVGMRERVAMFDGRLEVGPDAGDFVVRAELQVPPAPALPEPGIVVTEPA